MKIIPEEDIARELLVEWRDPSFNVAYRSGLVYTVARLLWSLSKISQKDPFTGPFVSEQLGVAFFLNDYRTLVAHRDRVASLRVVHLGGVDLGFVTRARGLYWVISNLWRGIIALRNAHPSSNGKSRAVPLLGWLLYQHITQCPSDGSNPSRYVIPNALHPLYLALAFGFARRGIPVDFVEHAMTPRTALRFLPIDEAYILSAHTVQAWREVLPTSTTKLHCVGEPEALQPARYSLPNEPRILICVNALDTLDAIESMLRAAIEAGGRPTVRVHDADTRVAAISSLALSRGAQVSLALRTPINASLDVCDLVICGNSNVLFDSLRRKKRVVYYWPNGSSRFDYYGCVEYYAMEFATSENELRKAIEAMIYTSEGRSLERYR